MAIGYAKQIRERIDKAKDGTIFIHADFVDVADAETVRQTLNRLVSEQVLNLLGLSTQVAAVWSYRSDGPYKTYQINNHRIEFKHRTNKEASGMSDTTALVIQALKELGRDNIDPSSSR